jgi:ATP-binding cassette subfamily A (ABC1) protein 1
VARLSRAVRDLVASEQPLYISILMPEDGYKVARFYDTVGPLIGLFMVMSTLYPVAMLIKSLVEEKESRVKETMKIMGMSDFVYVSVCGCVCVCVTAIVLGGLVLLLGTTRPLPPPLTVPLLLLLLLLYLLLFLHLLLS